MLREDRSWNHKNTKNTANVAPWEVFSKRIFIWKNNILSEYDYLIIACHFIFRLSLSKIMLIGGTVLHFMKSLLAVCIFIEILVFCMA